MSDVVRLSELAGSDAAAALARLRGRAPVSWVSAVGGWLVTGHAAALDVMRAAQSFTVDDPRFSTAQVIGASMLSLDGPEHTRHRTPFAPPFRAARVEARFRQRVQSLAADLVARIGPDGRADLRATVAGPLAVAIMAETLGLVDVDAATVLRWYAAIVAAVSAITAGAGSTTAGSTTAGSTTAGSTTAGAAIDELAAAVRRNLRDDSPILGAARSSLSDGEIVSNAAVMMFGGIETTEGMIGNLLVHVLRDDRALAAVRADPQLVRAAVEESLRLEPAAAVIDRYATTDVDLLGTRIAKGDLVRVSLAAANRDPAVFDRPDAFELNRPAIHSQLAFARGPHACIAMDLARLEAEVCLRTVLDRLPGLRLDGPVAATGLVFRKPDAVRVRWDIEHPDTVR